MYARQFTLGARLSLHNLSVCHWDKDKPPFHWTECQWWRALVFHATESAFNLIKATGKLA